MSEKTKTRFTSLDVTAMVNNLKKRLVGTRFQTTPYFFSNFRVNNIYDLNNKTYVFKLTRSEQKDFLLLESGILLKAFLIHF